mmetsp:Transcript_34508/g.81343  ORF Transcript_34508/g.81343 Transcript_34508/m.81343 type:complete len:239 (+) Transcript_34508:526-1242(+)
METPRGSFKGDEKRWNLVFIVVLLVPGIGLETERNMKGLGLDPEMGQTGTGLSCRQSGVRSLGTCGRGSLRLLLLQSLLPAPANRFSGRGDPLFVGHRGFLFAEFSAQKEQGSFGLENLRGLCHGLQHGRGFRRHVLLETDVLVFHLSGNGHRTDRVILRLGIFCRFAGFRNLGPAGADVSVPDTFYGLGGILCRVSESFVESIECFPASGSTSGENVVRSWCGSICRVQSSVGDHFE